MRPYWEGKRVRLRAMEPEDAQYHYDLNRQRGVDRNQEMVHVPSSLARIRKWVGEAAETGYRDGDQFTFQIEALETGEIVGTIDTHHNDARVGVLSYGIAILAGHRRKGYASDAICLVLRYYFLERRYQKVNVNVYSYNEDSMRLHERLGFTLEGRQRRSNFTAGEFHDTLWYGMTVEEFRDLHPEYLYGIHDD